MNPLSATSSAKSARFASLLGHDSVVFDEEILRRYPVEDLVPEMVLKPKNAEEVAAALRIANEEDWTVIPYGGGTRQHVGRTIEDIDVILSTERINAIEAYDPGDLTISLQAGALVTDVLGLCGEHRQTLPLEALPESTVGGVLAAAMGGPLRCAFGGVRDFCIGINFVTGDGAPGRGGGRVVKNVAGYDMMKLMIGSFGSLGVITSASFKLFPAPQKTMTVLCEFDSLSEVFQFRDFLLRSPLSLLCAEVISPAAFEYMKDTQARDPDVWAPSPNDASRGERWSLALRFAGSDRVLARCRKEVGAVASRELEHSEDRSFWQDLRAFESRVAKRHRNAMIFQLDAPIAESLTALQAAEAAATNYNFHCAFIGRATVGSFLVAFLPLAIDPPAVTQFASSASDFRSRLSRSASAIVVRCPREAKQHFDVWGSTPTDLELMRKIKRALDPKGILNRGRFLAG